MPVYAGFRFPKSRVNVAAVTSGVWGCSVLGYLRYRALEFGDIVAFGGVWGLANLESPI